MQRCTYFFARGHSIRPNWKIAATGAVGREAKEDAIAKQELVRLIHTLAPFDDSLYIRVALYSRMLIFADFLLAYLY